MRSPRLTYRSSSLILRYHGRLIECLKSVAFWDHRSELEKDWELAAARKLLESIPPLT